MKASKGGKGNMWNEEHPKKENVEMIFIKKDDKEPWAMLRNSDFIMQPVSYENP